MFLFLQVSNWITNNSRRRFGDTLAKEHRDREEGIVARNRGEATVARNRARPMISRVWEEAIVARNREEAIFAMNREVMIPRNREEATIPRNREEATIPRNREEATIPRNREEERVAELEDVSSYPYPEREAINRRRRAGEIVPWYDIILEAASALKNRFGE